MKYLIASILMLLGGVGLVVGKYGTLISILAWVVGLLGIIPYVSFWWVSAFMLTFILSIISASLGAFLVK